MTQSSRTEAEGDQSIRAADDLVLSLNRNLGMQSAESVSCEAVIIQIVAEYRCAMIL